ncbi:DUF5610 domain-containing protein [Aestuariibacter sp. AA17]|uniref:DUF5610 domain-containing protein n=1 Tax=Fluctibacter corallii TaxID=2984329 RepID=A0ABT3ADB8_9ALTE|nr:DUF5610 domain-containing protein [Aestuariibacter sp. AA17]MCV2886625.1 DUF5610 domain-containing protein [Aestuariibacter sp. AA17]
MNIGDIKAFMRDKPDMANPNQELRRQLQETGLNQAMSGIRNQSSISVMSSQTTIGIRVYSNSLNQSLVVNNERPNFSKPEKDNKSMFDFEEVAKNVLRFVGGVINKAASSGADKGALLDLFDQARSGVMKGIQMAEKDLEGFMNDEIKDGIANSRSLIEDGIRNLERKLLGDDNPQQTDGDRLAVSESVSASSLQKGDLVIRTADGDEVSIAFEDFKRFEQNKQLLLERGYAQPVEPDQPNTESVAQPQQASSAAQNNDDVLADTRDENAKDAQDSNAQQTGNQQSASNAQQASLSQSMQYEYFESSSLSFSVKGELDEDELKAIGNLVSDASDLADDFFNGDIESAFNKALELGFDEQELTGFALQLTRQEKVEVVKAYESVSHFSDDMKDVDGPAKAAKPISQYLEKMLDVMEQSKEKLEDASYYEKMINGIVNEMQDVSTRDLLSAINQFHEFNKRLLDNLPIKPLAAKDSAEGSE